MKPAGVKAIKQELKIRSRDELIELCLNLSKFKKENKELLTYLLFEADDENYFIRGIKEEIKTQFEQVNRKSYYYVKKSIRKILRNTKHCNLLDSCCCLLSGWKSRDRVVSC